MALDLSTVDIFKAVPLDGLFALAQKGTPRTFPSGEVLMRQGDPSDCMHVIMHGKVRVERSHPELVTPVVLAELGPGTTVGEMGVLDEAPRTAIFIAAEDTETIELHGDALAETLHHYPAVANALLHILSKRLRSTDELLSEVMRRRTQATGGPAAEG